MARFYGEITKDDFLNKIKAVMDNEDYPYKMTKEISKDLLKVDFDFENYTDFKDTSGFCDYPAGYKELADGFHGFFVNAGGDWEFPICFIIYWGYNKKLRAYIPKDGNAWHKKEKCAYGSNNSGEYDEIEADKEVSEEKIIVEILKHIKNKMHG